MESLLHAALAYADLGYRVFPCQPDRKEPATEHGCLDATTDAEQIERWWTENPRYNVAIATDGHLVVDVDPDGKSWAGQVDQNSLLAGAMAVTPRGGTHHWFRQNGVELRNTTGVIHRGVDTRANGGYVLVPPSVVGGKPYRWVQELEAEQPPVPAWIVEKLGHRTPVRESVGESIPSGSRNHALIRVAGLMRRGGMTEQEMVPALLAVNQTRCKPPLHDREVRKIAKSAARFEPDFVEEALILSHLHGVPDSETDEDEPVEEAEVVFPVECLSGLPRPLQDAYDYVLGSSIKPQPELTLGALIALFGAAFGRKVCDDYDTRTNVMILALAPSGAGKEHPRQKNKEFLLENGLDLVNGPERIGSHAGIISAVAHHPVRLFQLDEIGRLLATMRDPKVSHLYNVGTVLMALYSSANTLWTGDAYADLAKVKQIHQPHVCVYGTSVPESLYSGLSPDNLTDGLVGRLIVFQSLGIPIRRKPDKLALPWLTCEKLRQWHEFIPEGNGDLAEAGSRMKPVVATKTDEANNRHEVYCDQVNDKHRTEDSISAAVWARAPEKAAKLALIHACCAAPGFDVKITLESENWGIRLANYSTRLVLQAARNTVSGSKYESDLKRVFMAIRDGCSHHELSRRTQWLKPRERVEILADLQGNGAIEITTMQTKTKTKTMYRRRRNVL